jgi:hypothetical protein
MWPTVIPIFIKVFRKGWLSASKLEKTKIKSTSLIIRNTVPLITKLYAKRAEYYIAFHKNMTLNILIDKPTTAIIGRLTNNTFF